MLQIFRISYSDEISQTSCILADVLTGGSRPPFPCKLKDLCVTDRRKNFSNHLFDAEKLDMLIFDSASNARALTCVLVTDKRFKRMFLIKLMSSASKAGHLAYRGLASLSNIDGR